MIHWLPCSYRTEAIMTEEKAEADVAQFRPEFPQPNVTLCSLLGPLYAFFDAAATPTDTRNGCGHFWPPPPPPPPPEMRGRVRRTSSRSVLSMRQLTPHACLASFAMKFKKWSKSHNYIALGSTNPFLLLPHRCLFFDS